MGRALSKARFVLGGVLALMAALAGSAQNGSGLPSTFFAMTSVKSTDYPQVTIGTLAHPSTLAWGWIEREKGVYTFTGFDSYVTAATKHGLLDAATNTINMAITFGSTPGWAAADPRTCSNPNGIPQCTSPPANIQDWTDFITAVMNHYNGVTQPHMRYYELWNEANAGNFWTGAHADMVKMAKAAYPIIHADPHSMLLTPSVAGPVGSAVARSGTIWMAGYLDAGGYLYADGGAFHGYIGQTNVRPYPMPEQDSTPGCTAFNTCFGSIVTKATQMRQVFDDHGLKGKPMYQTEGSWGNGNITDSDTQVAWLARWYLLQTGLRASLNLQMAAWYTWGGGGGQTWGAIETAALTPTPAGLAYNQVYQWLVGATIDEPCSSTPDSTWTCTLTRPGRYVAQAVWSTAGSRDYTPGSRYTHYRDLAGNTMAIPAGGSVSIGAQPILVEGEMTPRTRQRP